MNRNKALALYLLGTLGQIWIICLIVFVLRSKGLVINYMTMAGLVAIGVGGISSALWGTVIAVKYKKYTLNKVLKDFCNIGQGYRSYLLAFLFLLLDFGYITFGGELRISTWYVPVAMFFKHIVFGGIEEVGWRYIFQPILQERCNYIVATVITFVMWGMWHFSYFYIEGTLSQVQASAFLLGLLVNCFILSALFIVTKSLWICVMTHSLINVFSQLTMGGNASVSYACKVIVIIVAVSLVIREEKNNERCKNQKLLEN
mgnify:FL=1